MDTLCPWCGAYGPDACELEDEMGSCPWVESGEYKEEPDPDLLRENLEERRRLEREYPNND